MAKKCWDEPFQMPSSNTLLSDDIKLDGQQNCLCHSNLIEKVIFGYFNLG